MDGVTLEQALNQIVSANQLFYKVLNPKTIMVIQDTAAKRLLYEEQVIKVLRLSHADATEVVNDDPDVVPSGWNSGAVPGGPEQDAEHDHPPCAHEHGGDHRAPGRDQPTNRRPRSSSTSRSSK